MPDERAPGGVQVCGGKPKPELNAEELVTALRLCAGATCEGCPCMCIEELVGCNDYVKRKAADMLEKLIKKEGNQNDHPTL